MRPVDNPNIFEPTTDPYRTTWLNLADRLQLERDLADLPTLAEVLDREYFALLARGDRDPDDSSVRYVTRFDVLDLADRRWKRDAIATDPAAEADTARRLGARRQGILPTLASWVSLAVGEMHDAGEWHTPPTDPDQIVWAVTPDGTTTATKPGPTVATEAGWLHRHLDWIVEQQWAPDLADELRRIMRDLEQLGINFEGPDHRATGTVRELAEQLDIPQQTIRDWVRKGWLVPIKAERPAVYVRHEVLALRTTRA